MWRGGSQRVSGSRVWTMSRVDARCSCLRRELSACQGDTQLADCITNQQHTSVQSPLTMVGIAGKSKACLDCKRRRVKVSPLCLRCAKAGIQCRGYEKPIIWVNRTPAQRDITALSVITHARVPRGACASRWLDLLDQIRYQLSGAAYDTAQFRARALILLQGIYLPQPHVMEDSVDPTPFSWPKAVCGMAASSEALDHALLAFCAIQVRLSGETGISNDETVQLYNTALGKVIRDVGRNNDETCLCSQQTKAGVHMPKGYPSFCDTAAYQRCRHRAGEACACGFA
ncbi:hypothetical protein VFPFJ_08359 [Purpureocillium lilacinum]|uniref:Zn(2)-C6 fungal-type domain-containing protein n=1 Tax=Purpureocillium lilacinum TaxID=33203 RepID=A0A179GX65_PURLI|nr:hypothetical protein VFPFJ_08359 [Purpureocillium lilacinum]OAQ82557.1 hypothetical protein VFPFJ_08359 [Purpureocillium lilacinum]